MKSDLQYSRFVYDFLIRKKHSRYISKKLYPFFRIVASILNTSRDYLVINLRSNYPQVYSVRNSKFFEYKKVQIEGNVRKLIKIKKENSRLNQPKTPNSSVVYVKDKLIEDRDSPNLFGICHGVRTGLENNYLKEHLGVGSNIIGTDISPTVIEFPNCIEWDFHETKKEWINSLDFVYSNSIDQSNKPLEALIAWLKCLKLYDGVLFLDLGRHTGKLGNTTLDPFSIEPELFPFFFYQQLEGAIIKNAGFPNKNDHRTVVFEISRISTVKVRSQEQL